jgi:drug/metabolite transporter (DMT)-like permease
VVILAGVGLALTPGEHLKIGRRKLAIGVLFCCLAALGGAGGAVLSREAYAVSRGCAEPIDGANAAFQRIVGGVLVGGICLLVVKRQAFKVQARAPHHLVTEAARRKWRGVWPWVLANSLAGQTLGVSFMQRALETTPTGIVLAIVALTPVVVIPFAWVFEKERPSVVSLAGGLIAVGGVIALILAR